MENGSMRVLLDPEDLPRAYYNILPDLPVPLPPPLNPATREPIGPEALPQAPDAPLRREGVPVPERPHQLRPQAPEEQRPQPRVPRDRDLGSPGGGSHEHEHEVVPRERAEPRPEAPDRDRAGAAPP